MSISTDMSAHRFFDGALTITNYKDVAQRLRDMLTGKRFTVTEVHEFFQYRLEARLHQRLKDITTTEFTVANPTDGVEPESRVGIYLHDSYGLLTLYSSETKENDTQTKTPWFEFFDKYMVRITHANGAGQQIQLLYIVEEPEDENDTD